MAISFVAYGTAVGNSANNITVSAPSGIAADDILILVVSTYAADAIAATNSYTELYDTNYVHVYWKRTTGTESTTTISGATDSVGGCIYAFSGCDTGTTPFGSETPAYTASNTGATIACPSFSTTANNEMVLFAFGVRDNNTISANAYGNLTSTGTYSYGHNTGTDTRLGLMYGLLASYGSIGTVTATQSSTDAWTTYVIALKPGVVTYEGTFTCAGTTAVSVSETSEEAIWEGTLTCAGTTAVSITGTHTDGIPFTSYLTGLSGSTDYHVRAWATNNNGATYAYGNEVDFTSSAGATTWEGTFTCAGTTTVTVAETSEEAIWEGSFTCAGTTSCTVTGAMTHAVWEGTFLVAGTTSTAVTAGMTHAIWEGSFACNGTSIVLVIESAEEAVWEGTLLCAGSTAVTVIGAKSEAVWEGSFACAGTTVVEVIGAHTDATWEGSLTCDGVTVVSVTGAKEGADTWEGTFTCAGATSVSVIESAEEAVWEGTLTCAGATAVSVTGAKTEAIWEGSFTVAGATLVAVTGAKTEAVWEGTFTCPGTTTVSVAATPTQAVWEGSLTCAGATAVTVTATPTQAVWEGTFTVAGVTAVSVTGAKSEAVWEGTFVCAGVTAVSVTGSKGSTWEGALTCAGTTAVSVTGQHTDAVWEGTLVCAGTTAVVVLESSTEAVWEGAFTCAGVSAVTVTGAKSEAVWEGSFACDGTSTVSVTGGGAGGFVSQMVDLNQSTHYYVRAWAENADGVSYGETVEFWTLATDTNPERTGSAILQGAAQEDVEGSAELIFSGGYLSLLEALEPSTHYYVRAWGENDAGVGYGSVVEFDTATTPSDDAQGSAVLREERLAEHLGSAELAATPGFTSSLTSLIAGTHYYVRAWAENTSGVTYGNEVEFTTVTVSYEDATGSATLFSHLAVADGSAQLQQTIATQTFRGLMGMLFHVHPEIDSYKLATGSADLRAARTYERTGSAVLMIQDVQLGQGTGSALLELQPVVFRGLMGMIFHARRSGLHFGAAAGSALLKITYVESGYAYGSAVLLRQRAGDAFGEAQLLYDPLPGALAYGSARLQGPSAGGAFGSASLAAPEDADATGSAQLGFAFEADDVSGSANLIDSSDGSSDGSAVLANDYAQEVRGSAMLRTIHKGKTRHLRRTDTTPTAAQGKKIAHMRRRSRKGMMDQWP